MSNLQKESEMDTDIFTQIIQGILGVLPSGTTADVLLVLTVIVTLCTLILRFWPEPKVDSKIHWLWSLVHLLASFKVPQKQVASQEGKASVKSENQSSAIQADGHKNV